MTRTPIPFLPTVVPALTAAALAVTIVGWTARATADTLKWSPTTGTNPNGVDASNTWSTDPSLLYWYDQTTNTGSLPWTNGNLASFGGGIAGAYTVTLGSAITASGIAFTGNNYTIAGGTGPFTLTLGSTGVDVAGTAYTTQSSAPQGVPTAAAGGYATITAGLAGTSGLLKTGNGFLVLGTAANSNSTNLTGGTTIKGGGIVAFDGSNLAAGKITVSSTAASATSGSSSDVAFLSFTSTGAVALANDLSFASGQSSTQYFSINKASGSTLTFTGNLSGGDGNTVLYLNTPTSESSTTFVFNGNGKTGPNGAFNGVVRLNRGSITIGNANAIGTGQLIMDGFTSSVLGFSSGFTLTNAVALTTRSVISTGANAMTLSGAISGGNGFTLTGAGALTLSGSNSYGTGSTASSAATTLSTGTTLNINSATAIGSSPLVTGGTATIDNTSSAAITLTTNNPITLSGGDLTFTGTKSLNVGTGAVTLSGVAAGTSRTVTVSANTLTLGGAVGDGGIGIGLTKAGAGTLALNGTNTYSGGTTINAGTVAFGNGSSLGAGTVTAAAAANNSATSVSSSNTAFLTYTGAGSSVTLPNNVALPTSPTSATVYTLSQTGVSPANSAAAQTVAYSGIISGGNAFTTLELNTQLGSDYASVTALNGVNTLAGTVQLNRGSLSLGNANALGSAALILQTNSNGLTTATTTGYGNLTFATGMTVGNNMTVNNGASSGPSFYNAAANPVTLSGVISGAGNLFKLGDGTLTLTNANTITGAVTVANGTLALSGGTNRLPAASAITLGSSAANTSGVLSVDGIAQTVAGLTTAGTGTGNAVVATNATASTLTVSNTADSVYAGALGGTQTNNNNFSFAKSGAGVLTLSGTGTYTGATTLNAGTLRLKTGAIGTGTFNLQTATLTGLIDGTTLSIANSVFLSLAGSTTTFGDASAVGTIAFTSTASGAFSTGTASSDRTLVINVDTSVAAPISGTNGNIYKLGASRLTLSNTGGTTALSATNGGVVVGGGTLEVTRLSNATVASSIGTTSATAITPTITLDGGTLTHIGGDTVASSTDRLLAVGRTTAGAVGTIRNDAASAANTLSFTNTGTVSYGTTGQARSLVFGGTNTGTNGFATAIGDNGTGVVNVAKQDAGTWVLTGSNSYTGGTAITAGTLRANNATSSLGSGTTVVTATGVLAGGTSTSGTATGATGGPVTVGTGAANGGGTITAGTGATANDTVGKLASGDQTWKGYGTAAGTGGTYAVKFASNTSGAAAAGTAYDTLSMSTLNISTANGLFTLKLLTAVGGSFDTTQNGTYTVANASAINLNGTAVISGTDITSAFVLDTSGLGLADSSPFSVSVGTDASSGLDLNVSYSYSPAPEPTTAALFGLGGSVLLARRRRRGNSVGRTFLQA